VAGDPISGNALYVDPNSPAAKQASAWRQSRPADAALMDKIAVEPVGKWFGGWNTNVYNDAKAYVDAAAAQGSVPVLISYNIPLRDCGGYSAGGATTPTAYQSWITDLANGIGSRKAVVILEPDALAGIDCLSSADQKARYLMLQNAVATLAAKPGVSIYIDAGNSNWVSAADMAPRLRNAGIALADGFALNVSNFYADQNLISFGQSLSPLVGNKHFVIDTSRNGLGPLGSEWCNPSGRALGAKPTANTGNPLIDAFLWLKTPGESDGACNGGPNAGVWWPDYALGLSQRAAY
jgi:endoglucanase